MQTLALYSSNINKVLLKRFSLVIVKMGANIQTWSLNYLPVNICHYYHAETVCQAEHRVQYEKKAVRMLQKGNWSNGRFGSATEESGDRLYEGPTERILPGVCHQGLPSKQAAPGKSWGFSQPLFPFVFETDYITGVQPFC